MAEMGSVSSSSPSHAVVAGFTGAFFSPLLSLA